MNFRMTCACVALIAGMNAAGAADADPLASPKFGTWGYDATGQDTAVKPGDDFFSYANGTWFKRTEIPADRVNYGMFHTLRELADARVRALIESAAQSGTAADEKLIGSYYQSFMDEARAEQLGATPIEAELNEIKGANDKVAIAKVMAKAYTSFQGTIVPFYVAPDSKHPDQWAVWADQGGTGLPDRDYYLDAKFAEKKGKYEAYVAQMLTMIGWEDAQQAAKDIVSFETEIAKVHWPLADLRDDEKTYNPMPAAKLAEIAPGFPWAEYLAEAGLGNVETVIISSPSAYTGEAKVFGATPEKTLKAWLAFNVANSAAPLLSKQFVDANFEFQLKTLNGQPEPRARWKRGVDLVNNTVPHAVGRLYAEKYFTPDAKAKMADLITNLRAAMKVRIGKLEWMSADTKSRALEKLEKLASNIGAPVKYRDYSHLEIKVDDLAGNARRVNANDWSYYLSKLGGPVDPEEWSSSPQVVNAWYRQTRNDITFPAAILQPPFFDPDADPAINYGAIGGVIGHEITHGFDDQGRKSDGDGVLRDWWTADDTKKFEAQADKLGAQYEAIDILPNAKINGKLTMGENIADLGGLIMGLEAYKMSLNGQPAPVVDGLTGEQRVFLGWAQVWRAKYRDDFMRNILVSDPHSPPLARVNGVVRNIDEWYTAFDVKPGDKLYLAPEKRVRIW